MASKSSPGTVFIHISLDDRVHHDNIPDLDCFCEPKIVQRFTAGKRNNIHVNVVLHEHEKFSVNIVAKVH